MEEKKYKTYLLYFYDESIEEENTCGQTLSAKMVKKQEKYDIWVGSIVNMTKDKILREVWNKDDVDFFVKEHPEASECVYNVHKYDDCGCQQYRPISENRNYKISKIFE